jgi:hypothetical protein
MAPERNSRNAPAKLEEFSDQKLHIGGIRALLKMGLEATGSPQAPIAGYMLICLSDFLDIKETILLQFETKILEFCMPFPFQAACEHGMIGRCQESQGRSSTAVLRS